MKEKKFEKFVENLKLDSSNHLYYSYQDLEKEKLEFLSILIEKNRKLSGISINHCTNLNKEDLNILLNTIAKIKTIKTLELQRNRLKYFEIKKLLEENKTLQTLNLSGNNLNPKMMKELSEGLKKDKGLENLFLNECKLNDNTLSPLFKTLSRNNLLKELHLNKNLIEENGLKELSDNLIYNHSLTHLNLNGCGINDIGAKIIAKMLHSNQSLKILQLNVNEIREGLEDLAFSLKDNNSLTTLNLNNNLLKDSGIDALSNSLKKNDTLKTLNLSYNYDLTKNSLLPLIDAIKENSSLQSLYLSEVEIDPICEKKLVESLKYNNTLSFISLNSISSLPKVNFLLNANSVWDHKEHSTKYDIYFLSAVKSLVLSLKRIQNQSQIKIPKFVLFEIIKRIDKKSFFSHKYPKD